MKEDPRKKENYARKRNEEGEHVKEKKTKTKKGIEKRKTKQKIKGKRYSNGVHRLLPLAEAQTFKQMNNLSVFRENWVGKYFHLVGRVTQCFTAIAQ